MLPFCQVNEKPSSPVWCSDWHQNHPKDVIIGRKRGLKFQAASQLACRLQDRRPGGSQLFNSYLASWQRPHNSTHLCAGPSHDAPCGPFWAPWPRTHVPPSVAGIFFTLLPLRSCCNVWSAQRRLHSHGGMTFSTAVWQPPAGSVERV